MCKKDGEIRLTSRKQFISKSEKKEQFDRCIDFVIRPLISHLSELFGLYEQCKEDRMITQEIFEKDTTGLVFFMQKLQYMYQMISELQDFFEIEVTEESISKACILIKMLQIECEDMDNYKYYVGSTESSTVKMISTNVFGDCSIEMYQKELYEYFANNIFLLQEEFIKLVHIVQEEIDIKR